jgi:hypothetical protein
LPDRFQNRAFASSTDCFPAICASRAAQRALNRLWNRSARRSCVASLGYVLRRTSQDVLFASNSRLSRKKVVYDFGGCVPSEIDSWRGIYSELALDYETVEPKTVEELLAVLKEANGKDIRGI